MLKMNFSEPFWRISKESKVFSPPLMTQMSRFKNDCNYYSVFNKFLQRAKINYKFNLSIRETILSYMWKGWSHHCKYRLQKMKSSWLASLDWSISLSNGDCCWDSQIISKSKPTRLLAPVIVMVVIQVVCCTNHF